MILQQHGNEKKSVSNLKLMNTNFYSEGRIKNILNEHNGKYLLDNSMSSLISHEDREKEIIMVKFFEVSSG